MSGEVDRKLSEKATIARHRNLGRMMEHLLRASQLVADIDRDLNSSSLQGCERLARCISYIVPLLDKLQTMRCPWGANTVRALRQLQDALERVDNAVLNCPQDSPYSGENGCEYVGALRQLWQRQIEMNLAVQFQRVLDEDVGRSACGIWEERKLLQVASPAGLVDEKVAMEPARR